MARAHRVTAQLIPLMNAGWVVAQPHPVIPTRRMAVLTRPGWHAWQEAEGEA